MSISKASSEWKGNLKAGKGTMRPANAPEIPYALSTRFEGAPGSNPEELLGAALTGCFSMALSMALERAGLTPESIRTSAQVHLEKQGDGFAIPRIDLSTEVKAQGDTNKIRGIAHEVEKQCVVSKALAGVTIALTDVKVQ